MFLLSGCEPLTPKMDSSGSGRVDDTAAQLRCWSLVAATWPSASQLSHLPLFWPAATRTELRGTVAGQRIEMLTSEAGEIFEVVISRALGGSRTDHFYKVEATASTKSGAAGGLRGCFVHAVCLVISRGLEVNYGRVDPATAERKEGEDEEGGPVLIPAIVELFNGLPEGEEAMGCNAEVFTGRPFSGEDLKGLCPWERSEGCAVCAAGLKLAVTYVTYVTAITYVRAPTRSSPRHCDAPLTPVLPTRVGRRVHRRASDARCGSRRRGPVFLRRRVDGRLSSQIRPRAARRNIGGAPTHVKPDARAFPEASSRARVTYVTAE